MKWDSFLTFQTNADGMARAATVLLFAAILILYSMPFETEYSSKLVNLFSQPWWRLLIIALVVTAAIWCPRVGIIVALAAFFYLSDVTTLVTPFVDLTEKDRADKETQ